MRVCIVDSIYDFIRPLLLAIVDEWMCDVGATPAHSTPNKRAGNDSASGRGMGRKRKVAAAKSGGEEDGEEGTMAKGGRQSKKAKHKVAEPEVNGDVNADGEVVSAAEANGEEEIKMEEIDELA